MLGFKRIGLLLAGFVLASSCFAQTTANLVWNNGQIYNGATSLVAPISSAEPTYTVYFKTTSAAAQDYIVRVQTSPDGVNWSLVPDHQIYVSRGDGAGLTYQVTFQAKTVKIRLIVMPANSATFSATASAWIVN